MNKVIIILIAVLMNTACNDATATSPKGQPSENSHTEFGIPKDGDDSDDYIIERAQYVISYNSGNGIPNWVSWNLEQEWYGEVPRYSGNFITDESLPAGIYQVKHSDYTNSGYDRGHMVRSEERTATDEDNKSTFLLTNIIPQAPNMNRGVWLDLEYYCEDLCKKEGKELYVIAGGINKSKKTLKDEGKVVIPDSCFKIVVVMDKDKGLSDVTDKTKVIAVVIPNEDIERSADWEGYITTVDNIEYQTGYDFLEYLPDAVEDKLEAEAVAGKVKITKNKPQKKEEVEKKSTGSTQCKGRTKKGTRCKRMTTDPRGYCWQH